MALFSRKNRPDDTDTVRLASADHSWWATGSSVEAGGLPDGDGDHDGGDVDDDRSSRIAAALEEYGYGAAGGGLDLSRLGGSPTARGSAPGTAGAADHGNGAVDEAALFQRDGLPADDRLVELLGTLGLGGDADWVEVARAHRRLVAPGTGTDHLHVHGDEPRRRAANEAYACLRLFHH